MAPRQIVILRHAEKPDDPIDPNLSPAGKARAVMLASLIPRRFPNPDFLFASAPSKYSNRPAETLTPLAEAIGLRLDIDFADQDYGVLATDLLNKSKYDGKLVIICWHHGHIPDLALAFGASASEVAAAPGMLGMHWDPSVFDLFWSLTFTAARTNLTKSSQA
jgi:phosphohistidine phosphatase SixA